MIEIRGDKKVLITPVSAEDLKDIHIGDIVWLDGDLMTCRDVAHRRLVEYGRELPYTRWFLSDRLLPCVWRNSSMNLQN